MPVYKTSLVIALAAIFWSCSLALQRPPPRYSQQYMPDTSFSCRNKIVGSYYADPETDCQLFHVCVSVAGSIQDYRFLCPNDTAFDQESQTCADWYDVDCEAATLYYASDNFDLYRLGSGLESLHYDSIRTDAEPQDNLQRSETSDAVRSSATNLNRVAPSNGYSGNTNSNGNANSNREIFRGSSSSNFYNSRNNGREDDYDNEKAYREENVQEPKKKVGVRKLARKQQYNGNQNNVNNNNNNNNNYSPSTTIAPPSAAQNPSGFNNGNYYNGNNNFNNQRVTNFASSTTARPVTQQDNYSRNQNTQKYNAPTSTYRPTTNYQGTYSSYQSPSTTVRTTEYNNYNANGYNGNTQSATNYNQSPTTTLRPSSFNSRNNNNNNEQGFTNQYNQFNQQSQSTTVQPSTNYQQNDYTNYQQRNYNNIQRGSSPTPFQTTTVASTFYDNYSSGSSYNANNNGQYNRVSSSTTARQEPAQTTTKYFTNNYAGSSYVPTTYSPATNKYVSNVRGGDRYNSQLTDDGQYFETSTATDKSTQYYDSTKVPKKPVQYNNYDTGKYYESSTKNHDSGKYYESSTKNYDNYDYDKSSAGVGFSPASVNLLAESPKTTTPAPRRNPRPSTYSPSTFSANTQRPQQQPQTTARGTTFVSASARPFSTTTRSLDATTARPKSTKKNDYDYAYYDNVGTLEYDGLDLEHAKGDKESSKIARN